VEEKVRNAINKLQNRMKIGHSTSAISIIGKGQKKKERKKKEKKKTTLSG